MWHMCRIIKKHRAEWVAQIAHGQVYDSKKELIERFSGMEHFEYVLNQETALHLLHGSEHQGDLKVLRNGVLNTYITDYRSKGKREIKNIALDRNFQTELLETNAILLMCVNHEPPFIKQEGNLVFLTGTGEGFASDWFGLVKQYFIEMGTMWTILSGIVIAISPHLGQFLLWFYFLIVQFIHGL